MTDPDAKDVLTFYFADPQLVHQIEPLGGGGGWSGSRLWRLTVADSRTLCLRRFPAGDWLPRLKFIHGILDRVTSGGLKVVPVPHRSLNGEVAVRHASHWWELVPWMPGQADFHAHPARVRLRCAMQTLARFHMLAGTESSGAFDYAPALLDRSRVVRAIDEHAARLAFHLQSGIHEALDARATCLLSQFRALALSLAPRVLAAAGNEYPLQPAIRDIWHDHVLFIGNEVTGIVDFGAMRVDTPLTDIARLVGSLVGDDGNARRFALDAYSELRPLSDSDRALIDLLDASGLVVAACNWLNWLYVERRDMGPIPPIVSRLEQISQRLSAIGS